MIILDTSPCIFEGACHKLWDMAWLLQVWPDRFVFWYRVEVEVRLMTSQDDGLLKAKVGWDRKSRRSEKKKVFWCHTGLLHYEYWCGYHQPLFYHEKLSSLWRKQITFANIYRRLFPVAPSVRGRWNIFPWLRLNMETLLSLSMELSWVNTVTFLNSFFSTL